VSAVVDQLLVYRLYEQHELEERDAALERHLAAPGPRAPLEPLFSALPGGCFRWEDAGRVHGDGATGLFPPTAGAARGAAAAYMRAANEAAARFRQARGIERRRHPDPFPTASLTPGIARRVRSRTTGRDDHWLTTWSILLPSTPGSEGGRSLVLGATVEVRVGAGGQVVGVVSRVRPWRSALVRPALELTHLEDDGNEHTTDEAAIVYVSDNPYEPLRFLAPCWATEPEDEESHHARRLWPACDHTVLPEIFVEEQRGEATASARVLTERYQVTPVEHGKDWRVRWSVATLAEYIAGRRRITEGSFVPLPGPGIYQVELELEHLPTRALRSTHRQVSILLPPSESRQPRSFTQS